jgi:hypothetical protein
MVVKYKKPRSINSVSIGLLFLLGLAVYAIAFTWPVYTLSSRAKGVLLDALPMLYRANLRTGAVADTMMADLKKSVPLALHKAGVKDPKLEVVFSRSKQEVSIEAHFVATAFFPVLDKTLDFHLEPRAVTDAARIKW